MALTDEEKIAEYLRTKGPTKCPGMGTKELADYNSKQIADYNAMTPEQRTAQHKKKFSWRGRPKSKLSLEERKAKQRAASKAWYAKNRDKRREYSKELWRKKKESRNQPKK